MYKINEKNQKEEQKEKQKKFPIDFYENQKNITYEFIYGKYILSRTINILMKHANKILAEKIFFDLFKLLKKTFYKNNLTLILSNFNTKILNLDINTKKLIHITNNNKNYNISFFFIDFLKFIKVPFEIKDINKGRKGGKTYQVPSLVSVKNQQSKALKLLLLTLKEYYKNIKLSFLEEIFKIFQLRSKVMIKNMNLYFLVIKNRAYSSYRWW